MYPSILLTLLILFTACASKTAPVVSQASRKTAKPSNFIEPPKTPSVPPQALATSANDMYVQAMAEYHRGQYQQALARLTLAIQKDYAFTEAFWARGEIYYDLGKYDQALNNYMQALQYDNKMIAVYLRVAAIYLEQKEFAAAKENLNQVLQIDQRHVVALKLMQQYQTLAADHYLAQGLNASRTGKDDQALADLQQALDINPNLFTAWLEMGNIREKKEQINQAVENYEKALAVNNNLPDTWTKLGNLYLKLNQADKAKQAFQRSLSLNPDQPKVQPLLREAQSSLYQAKNLPEEYLQISSNQSISRGELAAILAVNLQPITGGKNKENGNSLLIIPDITNHWAQKFITYTVKQDWMQPYPNRNFLPKQVVTRGELAAILDRIIARCQTKKETPALASPVIYKDISPEHQYYQAIMRLAAFNILAGYQKEGDSFLPDKPVSGLEALEVVDRVVEFLGT
ncbi:MAG: tetratricopeptide repeat protein [Candidatus Schekmanbacteria bacterium]|nr:tetratricopeptide repeat protein [Candidatus Schekmanbacteria bacterium]